MMPLKFRTLRSMGLLCLCLALNLLSQPALSQQDLLHKRISIDIKNLPVSKVLITIGQQAGATISYGNSQLDENRKVTISATNTTVADVIQQILGDELSDMMVAGDQIVIRTHEVSGTIHLTVTDMHGQPVPFAGVYLDNQQIAQTDVSGNYNLTKVRIGNHQIKVSSVGFQSQTKSFRMTRNGSLRVTIKLDEDSQSLQTVEVVGRKEKSYKNDASFIGSKIETKLKDLPQSVSYVTKELIADQGAMRVGDVLRNISGVSPFSTYDDINIRGFRIEGNKNTQLVNGMRSFTGYWKQPSINYLERVEVLKGPSSALFGNASPGGVINRVTKKPLDEARKSLQFSVGSFNAIRTLADFTGPIDKDKKLLYRLNLGYENAQSFRDLIFDKNLVIAPSFSFLPSAKTRLNFDMVYNSSQSRLDRAQAVFDNGDLYSTPVSRTMNTSNDFLNEQNYTVTASINHQILNNLSVNASFMKTGYQEDLNEHRSINTYAKDVNGAAINNQVFRHHWVRQSKRFMDNFTAFLNYHISTGNVAHKLVLGYDYALQVVPLGGAQMTATGYRNRENTGFFSDYDPKKKELYLLDPKTGNPVPNVPFYDLNNPAKSHEMQDISKYFYTSTTVEPAYYKLQSTYLQDQITVGRLQILAGLRYEVYRDVINYKKPNTETVTQQVILPRLGMVYTVNKNINVYGTYVQGYNPQTAAAIANPNAGGPFDPLESNMSEIGLKSSWLDGDLEFTSSVYQIKQKNTLYSASSTENPDLLEQIGRERAKGFEFDLQGKILPNWNLLLSYAYNDAQITESANTYDLNVQKPNAPKNSGNLWTRYSVAKGVLRGFAVGLGVSYADARNLRVRGNEKQSIPSYTLINAALYYNVGKAQLQFNLNNVVNKTYWVGGYDYVRLFPGAPRNSMVTLIYSL